MSAVNSQVLDSVTQVDTLNVGIAASTAMGMTYIAMADSISKVMQNASTAQQNGQLVASAATATTCAMIVKNGTSS